MKHPNNIAQLRYNKGWTQEYLHQELLAWLKDDEAISEKTMQRIELGLCRPRLHIALALCKVLGIGDVQAVFPYYCERRPGFIVPLPQRKPRLKQLSLWG